MPFCDDEALKEDVAFLAIDGKKLNEFIVFSAADDDESAKDVLFSAADDVILLDEFAFDELAVLLFAET